MFKLNETVRTLALAASVAVAAQAQSYHQAVEALFNSTDPFIKGTVLPNIEKNRKADAKVTVVDGAGNPLAGVKVSVRQIEHAFLWGAVPPMERAQGNNAATAKLWRDIFNFGVPEYHQKWQQIEKVQGTYDWKKVDEVLAWFTASGAEMEYHFLTGYHPGYGDDGVSTDQWKLTGTDAEKAAIQDKYAYAVVERYKDKIKYYQVYNEDLFTHIPRAHYFGNQTKLFDDLVKKYPNLVFGMNDCFRWHIESFLPKAEFKTLYPGIKFVGQHAHNPNNYWVTPQRLYELYDPLIDPSFKVHLTEFGVYEGEFTGGRTGSWNTALKNEYFVTLFATVFSHPAVGAINMWGIGPNEIPRWKTNRLIELDGTPNDTYAAIKSLVRAKLMTTATGATDASGIYPYRGFHGKYEITIEKDGLTGTAQITVPEAATAQFRLKVQPGAGGLVIDGADPVSLLPLETGRSAYRGPAINAPAGQPVLFTGLRETARLEILDPAGRKVQAFGVVGERLLWDRTAASGSPVGPGAYLVRTVSLKGETSTQTLVLK